MCGKGRMHNKLQQSGSIGGKATQWFISYNPLKHEFLCCIYSDAARCSELCWNVPGEVVKLSNPAANAAHHLGAWGFLRSE